MLTTFYTLAFTAAFALLCVIYFTLRIINHPAGWNDNPAIMKFERKRREANWAMLVSGLGVLILTCYVVVRSLYHLI